MADASLVERARRGDAAAFGALVRRHFRAAYAVALAQLGDAMDAEDVCQDAFVRALERLDQCREPAKFAGWLMTIVRNCAHNFRRYERVRATEPLDPASMNGPGPGPPGRSARAARDVERGELRALLETALAELSPAQREVVLLHDMEGWKHREIAERLGLSEVASRQHLFNARRALREGLGANVLREYSNDD